MWLLYILLLAIKIIPSGIAIRCMGRFAYVIGRYSSRHKLIIKNLKLAFPELNDAERKRIAKKMWWHMGALLIEYLTVDKIVSGNNIIVENGHILDRVASENAPHIFFTAHIGNFELLPILAKQYNVDISVLFRPPNNKYVADMIYKIRSRYVTNLIASKHGAAIKLNEVLQDNGSVGVLVDQKFRSGVDTIFFNHPIKTNPISIKLAKKYNCDIYPAQCEPLQGWKERENGPQSYRSHLD